MSDARLREAERAALHDPSEAQRFAREQHRVTGCPTLATLMEAVDFTIGLDGEKWLDQIRYEEVRAQTSDGPRHISTWICPDCGGQCEERRP